jgi:hypothetical protein
MILIQSSAALGQAASGAGQSAISGQQAGTERSPWRVSYFNLATAGVENANRLEASVFTYNYISLGYAFRDDLALSVRPAWSMSSSGRDATGRNVEADVSLQDPYLNLAWTRLGDRVGLPEFWKWGINFRAHAPLTESSRQSGLVSRLRAYSMLEMPVSKDLGFTLHFIPEYYLQTEAGVVSASGRARANRDFGYESWLEAAYRLNRIVSLTSSLGFNQMWMEEWAERGIDGRRDDTLRGDMALSLRVGGFWTVVGLQRQRSVESNRPLSLFDDRESSYFARTIVSL